MILRRNGGKLTLLRLLPEASMAGSTMLASTMLLIASGMSGPVKGPIVGVACYARVSQLPRSMLRRQLCRDLVQIWLTENLLFERMFSRSELPLRKLGV